MLKPGDCPRSKCEALFDERPIFDAIRESFLVTEDSQRERITIMLQEMVTRKSIPGNCEKKIVSFIEELVAARSEWKSSYPDFAELVWESYVDAISTTGSYYILVNRRTILGVSSC